MQLINALNQLYVWTIFEYGYIILFCMTHVTANHCNRARANEFYEAAAQLRAQQNESLDATLGYVFSRCM